MGRRDYRWREAKKTKKDAEKTKTISEIIPQAEVEVVRKRSKKPGIEE